MLDYLKRTWAEISLDNIIGNVKYIKSVAKDAQIMAIVKADAYAHGDVMVAKVMEQSGDVSWFGVSNISEALSLRQGGIKNDILILGYTPVSEVKQLCEHNITQTVFSRDYGTQLSDAACYSGVTVNVHIKIDTGMNRIGFKPDISELEKAFSLKNLKVTGTYTHLSCSDMQSPEWDAFTENQFELFTDICGEIMALGFDTGLKHCCNSAATLRFKHMHLDIVRPGLILYGLSPDQNTKSFKSLKPAMEIKTIISMVKEIESGSKIGYGATFEAQHKMKIATVPIGYADGYPRRCSSKGRMLVGGKFVPVVGRVCMDQLMLDVTGVKASEGDIVTVFGKDKDNEILVDEISEIVGTINYEIICFVGRRVPRVYIKNNSVVEVIDYLT